MAMTDSELEAKRQQSLLRLETYKSCLPADKPDFTYALFRALLAEGTIAAGNPEASSTVQPPVSAPERKPNPHIISWIISPQIPAEWEPLSPSWRDRIKTLVVDSTLELQCSDATAEECDDETLKNRGKWWYQNLIKACSFPHVGTS